MKTKVPKEIEEVIKKNGLKNVFESFLDELTEKKPSQAELCRHAGVLSKFVPSYIGEFNPDDITIDIYDKMKRNPQISAGLKCIKYPIYSLNWTVKSDSSEVKEFIHMCLDRLKKGLVESSLTAIEYGFSAHEIVWKKIDGFFIPKKIKSLHPRYINIKIDEKDNFRGIVQTWMGQNIHVPPNKCFLFTHDKGESFGNLFGISRLKPAYEPWYWWCILIQFMMKYFERRGIPATVVKFPPGKTKEGTSTADIAIEVGKAIQSEAVAAIPSVCWETYSRPEPKWDIKFLEEQKRGDMFLQPLVSLEAKMLRAMFVPERVITQDTLSKTGSYSLSKVHADMFLLGEEGLATSLEDQINKYIVRRIVQFNFGNKVSASIEIEKLTEARKEFLKEVFMEMMKTGDAKPAARAIAETLGLPMEPETEKETKSETLIEPKTETIELQDKRWWRDTNDFEDERILVEIEDTLDSERDKLENSLVNITNDIEEKVISKLDTLLRSDGDLTNLWYREIRTITPEGKEKIEKIIWEPRRSDIKKLLLDKVKIFYLFGQETALKELKVKEDVKLDKRYWNKLTMRAQSVLDEFYSDMRYKINLIMSETLDNISLIPKIRGVFSKIRSKKIPTISDTELMTALNTGRKQIMDYYAVAE